MPLLMFMTCFFHLAIPSRGVPVCCQNDPSCFVLHHTDELVPHIYHYLPSDKATTWRFQNLGTNYIYIYIFNPFPPNLPAYPPMSSNMARKFSNFIQVCWTGSFSNRTQRGSSRKPILIAGWYSHSLPLVCIYIYRWTYPHVKGSPGLYDGNIHINMNFPSMVPVPA